MPQSLEYGVVGALAPEWRVEKWIDGEGNTASYSLSDFSDKVLVIFGFQSWCPGCHSSGFPTLQRLVSHFKDSDEVKFVAIQTVFEGFEANTEEKAWGEQRKYDLHIPFGHDPGDGRSTILQDYKTGGTPWFIIMDRKGVVRFNNFQIDINEAIKMIEDLS